MNAGAKPPDSHILRRGLGIHPYTLPITPSNIKNLASPLTISHNVTILQTRMSNRSLWLRYGNIAISKQTFQWTLYTANSLYHYHRHHLHCDGHFRIQMNTRFRWLALSCRSKFFPKATFSCKWHRCSMGLMPFLSSNQKYQITQENLSYALSEYIIVLSCLKCKYKVL